MTRKVGSKRRNTRGTARGLRGKYRATGFKSRQELARRNRAHFGLVVVFGAFIALLIAFYAVLPPW